MITDVHKGRKIKVSKGRERGTFRVAVNGVQVACSRTGTDQQVALADVKNTIDFIDRDPVVDGGRWGAEWYAPGTYELCLEGHPVAIGGRCRHPYCAPPATCSETRTQKSATGVTNGGMALQQAGTSA